MIIYNDYIQIKLTFAKTKKYNPDPPTKEELTENEQKNNLGVTFVTPRCGGEGLTPQPSANILVTFFDRKPLRGIVFYKAQRLLNVVNP